MIGDLIGKPGRATIEGDPAGPARGARHRLRDRQRRERRRRHGPDAVHRRVDPAPSGVDVITSGNHIWDKREIYPFLEANDRVLRPLNYGTHDVPGRGWGVYSALDGTDVAVINLQGRTYMQQIENPFTDADRLLDESSEPLPPVRLVDFHCELTSEKNALGLYLDGRVSVVVGTHTHVVTGDERILPNGTAYQTDIGMTGPIWSVIGFAPQTVIPRFINALPTRFEVGEGPVVFNAVQVDIDPATGPGAPDRTDPAPRSRPSAWRTPRRRRHDPLPPGGRGPGPVHPARRRSTCTRTRRAPTGWSPPADLVAGSVGRRRPHPQPDRPRHAGRVSRRRRERRRAARVDAHPRRRDQRARDPRPRAVGGRAAHPRLRHGSRRTRRSRRCWPRSATTGAAASSGPWPGCASSSCRSTPRSPRSRRVRRRCARAPDDRPRPDGRRARRERRGRASAACIGHGAPAYVRREGLGPEDAIAAIRAAGGLPVLAHFREAPGRIDIVRELVDAGLAGLEVYYRTFEAETVGRGRGRGDVARPARDRRHRLPRRPRHVRRGARRPVGAARGGRRPPGPAGPRSKLSGVR